MRPNQKKFIEAYRDCGTIRAAADASGVGRRTHYDWLREEEYKAEFEGAKDDATELLEGEARRRAFEGVQKVLMDRGEPVMEPLLDKHGCVVIDKKTGKAKLSGRLMMERIYSDTLLIFLLKAAKPDVYRDNVKHEVGGPGDAPLEVTVRFVKP